MEQYYCCMPSAQATPSRNLSIKVTRVAHQSHLNIKKRLRTSRNAEWDNPRLPTWYTSCNLTQSPGLCRIYLRMMGFVRSHALLTKHSTPVELIQLSLDSWNTNHSSSGDSVPCSFHRKSPLVRARLDPSAPSPPAMMCSPPVPNPNTTL